MANQRTGAYGTYFGSFYNESSSLSEAEMKVNAIYIYEFFFQQGWTVNAMAGILGNMQAESALNPGRWQSENVGNTSGGYGLVQWTPATNYLNWCTAASISDPSEMDANLTRIMYEMDNGLQWIATDAYPLSFSEFSKSTESPSYLASAFLKNYERAGVEVEATRQVNAESWYAYLTSGAVPEIPGQQPEKKKKKGYNFVLFNRQRKAIR